MGVEIERKFIVAADAHLPRHEDALTIKQGYLSASNRSSVRIRISNDRGYLNIKAVKGTRLSERYEYEYEIPLSNAEELLALCDNTVTKTRLIIPYRGYTWEVDLFDGANEGLVLAEVELPDIDADVSLPEWVGREVSDDYRYLNTYLSRCPYTTWDDADKTE